MSTSPLIAIVGPTAVGKTAISVQLAELFKGEIISADSRQIYIGMDIGTAKASVEMRRRVPHHLLDLVRPDQPLTLADFQRLAFQAIESIAQRGHLPMLVGGTGLYTRAVLEGWSIPRVPPNPTVRTALEREGQLRGAPYLHRWLQTLDPDAAARIDPRNVRRVVRALEVCLSSGRPISQMQRKREPPYRILCIGLTMPRQALYRRIDERIDQMIASGLVDEVRGLLEKGDGLHLPAMSGLGYRQIGRHLSGQISLEEAVALTKRATRQFVRQQYTWYRLDDARIRWFDVSHDGTAQRLQSCVSQFLAS